MRTLKYVPPIFGNSHVGVRVSRFGYGLRIGLESDLSSGLRV